MDKVSLNVSVRVCACVCWGREWLLCEPASLNPSGRGREREPTHSLELCMREKGCVWAHVSARTGDDKPSGKGRLISKNSSKMEPQRDGKKRTWTLALQPALDFLEKRSWVDSCIWGLMRKYIFLSTSLNREGNKRTSEDPDLPSGAQFVLGFHEQEQGSKTCWTQRQGMKNWWWCFIGAAETCPLGSSTFLFFSFEVEPQLSVHYYRSARLLPEGGWAD